MSNSRWSLHAGVELPAWGTAIAAAAIVACVLADLPAWLLGVLIVVFVAELIILSIGLRDRSRRKTR